MDPIKINCQVSSQQCDMEAREIACAEHKGACFALVQDSIVLGTICKTIEGAYIIVGQSGLNRDDTDGIGEQIDAEFK